MDPQCERTVDFPGQTPFLVRQPLLPSRQRYHLDPRRPLADPCRMRGLFDDLRNTIGEGLARFARERILNSPPRLRRIVQAGPGGGGFGPVETHFWRWRG